MVDADNAKQVVMLTEELSALSAEPGRSRIRSG
ncbi:hypothetical protein ACLB1Q_12235 [Escherichia coli]